VTVVAWLIDSAEAVMVTVLVTAAGILFPELERPQPGRWKDGHDAEDLQAPYAMPPSLASAE
jgi:hypothetical protein